MTVHHSHEMGAADVGEIGSFWFWVVLLGRTKSEQASPVSACQEDAPAIVE
jgi:hypothetical protein